jgi:hypothetical protein
MSLLAKRSLKIMRYLPVFATTAQLLTGCGAAAVQAPAVPLTSACPGSLSVGEPRVLSSQVNPMQPLRATAASNAIAVTFARRGQAGSVLTLEADSLRALSSSDYVYAGKPTSPPSGTESVTLADGGSLVVWTEGSIEGHRAMARSFEASGVPRSAPVVISPATMDVFGAPRAATTDGHRVVVTLAATQGQAFELVGVPIQVL